MAWTTPRDWTVGEIVTAAHLNAQLRDNLLELARFASGTYTGDGTGARTIPLGFAPEMVTIWQDGTATWFLNNAYAHEHTSVGLTSTSLSRTNAAGFLVDSAVNNASGATYRYVAVGPTS